MKQLIVPVAIIVALIVFFVIVDRKEFNRYEGVQTVQSERPMTNRKPTVSVPETKPVTNMKTADETKPVDVKPTVETKTVAEIKPVTEARPTETKPVVETKPTEVKPVAETKPAVETKTKPAEVKPVAQTKPEEKPMPAAVPIATAEEAQKLNAEAMAFVRKHTKRMYFASKGMNLVYDDKINTFTPVSIEESFDETFRKNGVVKTRSEFLTKRIPYKWTIDYNAVYPIGWTVFLSMKPDCPAEQFKHNLKGTPLCAKTH